MELKGVIIMHCNVCLKFASGNEMTRNVTALTLILGQNLLNKATTVHHLGKTTVTVS